MTPPLAETRLDDRFTSRILYANGQRLHAVETGEGPLVLFCHGFPESWYSWRHQMTALAAHGYRAVALDMRGYGRSSKPSEIHEYRITALVEDCVGAVAALGADTAVIVGHDWGAPVAWSAAWTRPDVLRAVAGLSVCFGGRGVMTLPADPLGARRPSEVERELARPGTTFYMEHFRSPAGSAEFVGDVAGWLRKAAYGFSADPPLPPDYAGVDLTTLPQEAILQYVQAALCVPIGEQVRDLLPEMPDPMPGWVDDADLEWLAGEFERGGLEGPLNWYRCIDLDWELLAPFDGQPVQVPSLYIGGDRDLATIWGAEARALLQKTQADLRGEVILEHCGHWVQREQPEGTTAALLEFLGGLDR